MNKNMFELNRKHRNTKQKLKNIYMLVNPLLLLHHFLVNNKLFE